MSVLIETYGKEYTEALMQVLEVRAQRREQYGDAFVEDTEEFLIMQIDNKLKRTKVGLNSKNKALCKDSLIDLINYSLFLIHKI